MKSIAIAFVRMCSCEKRFTTSVSNKYYFEKKLFDRTLLKTEYIVHSVKGKINSNCIAILISPFKIIKTGLVYQAIYIY